MLLHPLQHLVGQPFTSGESAHGVVQPLRQSLRLVQPVCVPVIVPGALGEDEPEDQAQRESLECHVGAGMEGGQDV